MTGAILSFVSKSYKYICFKISQCFNMYFNVV